MGDPISHIKSSGGSVDATVLLKLGCGGVGVDDLNDVFAEGVYTFTSAVANNPVPYSGSGGILIVCNPNAGDVTDYTIQIVLVVGSACYTRMSPDGTTWNEWSSPSLDPPYRVPFNGDIDTLTRSGTHVLGTGCTNVPMNVRGAFLLVLNGSYVNNVMQILFSQQTGAVCMRVMINDGWLDWYGIGNSGGVLVRPSSLDDVRVFGKYGTFDVNTHEDYSGLPSSIKLPAGPCILEVAGGSNEWPWQILTCNYTKEVWARRGHFDADEQKWYVWVLFSNGPVPEGGSDPIETSRYSGLLGSFMSVGVIGDSLASGQGRVNSMSDYKDFYDQSWPQVVARDLGITVHNFTKSGLTTRTWLSDPMGYPLASDGEHKVQCYIVGLGANDVGLGSEYLGSRDDVHVDDYHSNADTYYGNYAKIIQMMKEVEPRAKFFLLPNPAYGDSSLRPDFNAAVEDIAGMFDDCYFIDLDESLYTGGGFIHDNLVASHYTPAAYNYMAKYLEECIGRYMYDNPEEFKFVNLIGTEYSDPE